MSGRLIDFLLRLAPRERRLLGLLVLIVLPLGVVFGLLLPLQEARERALTERAEAVALNLWVQDRAAEMQGLQPSVDAEPRTAIGTSGIEEALIGAGLRDRLSELSSDSEGVVVLRFEDVRFTRLADWLSTVSQSWGYDIALFRFEAGDAPGNVAASLTLTPWRSGSGQ